MTKAELCNAIAIKTGVSKTEILVVLEAAMETISDSLVANESVFLRGFGTFQPKTRKAKVARNIKRKLSVFVPEHRVASFKACPDFAERLKLPIPVVEDDVQEEQFQDENN